MDTDKHVRCALVSKARPNQVIATLTRDSYALWGFHRLAERLYNGNQGAALQAILDRYLRLEDQEWLAKRGATLEAYEVEHGLRPKVLEHPARHAMDRGTERTRRVQGGSPSEGDNDGQP